MESSPSSQENFVRLDIGDEPRGNAEETTFVD